MKRKISIIFCAVCVFALIFGGCRSKKKEDNSAKKGTAVYYTNENGTRLISVNKDVKLKDDAQENVGILLNEMKKVSKDEDYQSVIPEGIVVNSAEVNNNIVMLDFSTGYSKLDNNEDLICQAGIVYTLTQIDNISYVSFSVSGKTMLDTDGKAIGALGRDSFVFGELPMEEEE